MVKQWKKSLEQSDILSDGTPFDGNNIDAPISEAGGGVDWSALTPKIDTVSSGSTVTVNGSGYAIGVTVKGFTFGNVGVNLSIDSTDLITGTPGMEIADADTGGMAIPLFTMHFSSSFEVTETRGDGEALLIYYVLE